MSSICRCGATALFALWALVLPACKSAPNLEPEAGLRIIRDLSASSSIEAGDYFFDEQVEATYDVVAGKGKGSSRMFRRLATEKHGAAVQEELFGMRVEFLRMDVEGNIVMPAVVDHANSALSLFDPPLVILPAVLRRGEPFEARALMRVVDARNPSKEKEHGTAARTVTYVGNSLLNTPIGEIECAQLRIAFTADLRMANAETLTMLYVSPIYGIVAEQSSEVVTVFGALSSEKGDVMVLASEPK